MMDIYIEDLKSARSFIEVAIGAVSGLLPAYSGGLVSEDFVKLAIVKDSLENAQMHIFDLLDIYKNNADPENGCSLSEEKSFLVSYQVPHTCETTITASSLKQAIQIANEVETKRNADWGLLEDVDDALVIDIEEVDKTGGRAK
jgi:hypothetical protein